MSPPRKVIVIPMVKKKKLDHIAERAKGKHLTVLQATQFALEEAVKRIAALEKQADGLARLDKEKDFVINGLAIRVKRLEDRERRRDDE